MMRESGDLPEMAYCFGGKYSIGVISETDAPALQEFFYFHKK
jgi:hypothetical protein